MSSDDEAVVVYEWVIVTGDVDGVTLDGADKAVATAYGLKAGQYTLKLTVFDRLGQMDEDDVTINVEGHYFTELFFVDRVVLNVFLCTFVSVYHNVLFMVVVYFNIIFIFVRS